MVFIVVVSWPISPNQNMDLYPAVLKGFKVKKRFRAPQVELFAFDTEQEALELKARIEKEIPTHTYNCLDVDNKPIIDKAGVRKVVREPQITIGYD
jgi:hypothetical protein